MSREREYEIRGVNAKLTDDEQRAHDARRHSRQLPIQMLGELIEFVARIWHADSQMRARSLLGESEFDKRSRRFVACLCGGTIALLILAGISWWWFTRP